MKPRSRAAAEKGTLAICKATIIDPATYEGMDEMVAKMVELRKGKMTEEQCRELSKGNYFGTMLVKMGKADALLGGATYSTADTVRPALQLVKTRSRARTWCPPASSAVREATRSWPWATAPSTSPMKTPSTRKARSSSPPRRSWRRSPSSPRAARSSSALTRR